jgi:Ca2+-binding RTX toxin-like protein
MADYVLEGPRWGSGPAGSAAGVVTWAIDASVPISFVSVFSAAFADWARYANITFQQVSSTSASDIDLKEAQIDGLDNVLAQTDYTYRVSSGSETFNSAAITFDSGEGWHVASNAVVSNHAVSLYVVALHEIGHAIGLDHYDAAPAIMNTYVDRSVSDLTSSEIDGIHALYGLETMAGTLSGSDAEDMLTGTAGADTIIGGAGNDTISGADGADLIYGNLGTDIATGGLGDDTLFGGQGSDLIYGNLGNDAVYGNLGDDVISAGQGNDLLFGGQGSDLLVGGAGNDVLTGGLGADRYVFGANSGADLILGFSQAEGDKLNFGGQSYTATDDGQGGTLFTLSGGGTVDVAGVPRATVNPLFFS